MAIKWIVLVNRVDARIFTEKTFRLLAELKNDLGREKNKAMTTDKPGRASGKFASRTGVHTLSGEKNPHEDAAIEFAKRVTEYLHKQSKLNLFDELLVIAEPKMMGRLKSDMDKSLVECTHWLAKDFGKASAHELKKLIGA